MAKPTIILIPGLWSPASVYDSVRTALQSPPHSYPVACFPLLATGQVYPNSGKIPDDVAHIRSLLKPFLDDGKELILVMHSAGAFLGSSAIEGMGIEARKKEGKEGGIRKLVYLAGGLAPEGTMHPELPFAYRESGKLLCKSPESLLFNDLPPSLASEWASKLQSHPDKWDDIITYGGWKDIPSVYVVCEKDAVLPAEFQTQIATMAGSEIVTVDSGHMIMISQPEKVVEIVLKAAVEN